MLAYDTGGVSMRKRFFLVLLVCSLLISALPGASAAGLPLNGTEAVEVFCNSDKEAAFDGTCWYVDTMTDGCLMAARMEPQTVCCTGRTEAGPETVPLTDWPVDQVLYWEGRLLACADCRLLTLDSNTGKVLDSVTFDQRVDRFACGPAGLCVLTGGAVLLLRDGERTPLLSGVTRFWLEEGTKLCYMRDESVIYTWDLAAGTISEAPNPASDLGDVLVPAGETRGMGLVNVREKFPHGKYWNHMPNLGCGMKYNNQDGWTETPCPKHNGYCGTAKQSCNGYAPEGKELSYQCWGYADKLGHDVSGYDPQNLENGPWTKLYYKASLDGLKAGDIVRYNKNGNSSYAHSIYVTAVSGDTVTYSDCNYDGTCVIRWNQTISKSTLRTWFVFLLKAPAEASAGRTVQLKVSALLDGTSAVSSKGWGVFDVKLDGKTVASGVTSFSRTVAQGTSYEICNVKPGSGILFDKSAVTVSGRVEKNLEIRLPFHHYYLNEAGKQVKTTLTDLPKQSHWSYRAICWALERGIAGGVSATRFAPNEVCTRGQIVTFLWAYAGRPVPKGNELPFRDVKRSSYYYQPVLWAMEAGITAGKSETVFAPDDPCTRGEAAAFLWNLAGKPEPASAAGAGDVCPFDDVQPGDFYYRAVLWAVDAGITGGTGPRSFSPEKACTRAEILTFLLALSAWSGGAA